MPRKPQYLSHNFDTQPPDNETQNKVQRPWFPVTYGSQIDGHQNSSTNTDPGQSSLSNDTSQNSSLQSKNGCHKRKADAVVQISTENHEYNSRNVKPHVQLAASLSILPNNGSPSVKLSTASQEKLHIQNNFCQKKKKKLQRKKKPPDLGSSDSQENQSVARNIKRCLESHDISDGEDDTRCNLHISSTSSITDCYCENGTADQPQYSDPSLHHKRLFSAESVLLMANEIEVTHDRDSVANVSHEEQLYENRSSKRLCQQSGQTSRRRTEGTTHNVRQRLRANNLLNTVTSSPTPIVEEPTVLPNPVTHDRDSVANVSHEEQLYENRSSKRLCQQSGQTSRRRTGGTTHNVWQRLRANNLLNTVTSSPTPIVEEPTVLPNPGTTHSYEDLGDCDQRCRHCGAAFWYEERVKRSSTSTATEYHLCCSEGRFIMDHQPDPPEYIKQLISNKNFMENIRAYNQMFAMTSFGATIDKSVNDGRGPYVFKVSGQIYHWIGSLCPLDDNDTPRFLQLYIYDTKNEVQNRMSHFEPSEQATLDPEIVQGLINFFDANNELVQILRTARDLCNETNIPEFKLRLYNAGRARGYELPTSNTLAAIVFDSGP